MIQLLFLLVCSGAVNADTSKAALPVHETWVPPDVMTTITNTYNPQGLYDITKVARDTSRTTGYVIRLIQGSTETTQVLDSTGAKVQ